MEAPPLKRCIIIIIIIIIIINLFINICQAYITQSN